jgi:hypothetical protein
LLFGNHLAAVWASRLPRLTRQTAARYYRLNGDL